MSYTRDRKLFNAEDEKFLKSLRIGFDGHETVVLVDHDEAIAAYLCQTADQPAVSPTRAEQEAEFHRRARHYYLGCILIGFGAWALGRLIFG